MLPNKTQFYEFADFRLDRSQKVLLRNGTPVPLTPKVFDTLEIFVENPGRLLEKNELMQQLWQDHFVEEGNLTSNIKMLRRALGDDALHPRFIETVPRRGYRFIADVNETPTGDDPNLESVRKSPKPLEKTLSSRRFNSVFAAAVILVVGVGFSGFWFARTQNGQASAHILSAPFSSEKLSTNGKVLHAVLSLDGKNVVFTNGIEGKQSIWLRQLESSHSVEIISSSDDFYYGLALSPDGNFLYFARSPRHKREIGLYRVSIFGGVPTKIISGSEGWMSISPDGAHISFVRCPYTKEEYCSLWIADAINGKNERKLTSRPQPIRIGANKISQDGKSVAFAVGQSLDQANEFGLTEIDIESGLERDLTTEKFFNIKSLTWLQDRSGLLITAARIPNKQFRIWEVSLPSGAAQPLTSDSVRYNRLSLNKEATLLVSTQSEQDFRLFLFNPETPIGPRVLADASRAAFFPHDKIVFASVMSGNDEIWSINLDGSEQRQLTNDPADDSWPIVSTDNDLIFFASNRTGSSQVWRMKADGTDQAQVTFKEGGRPFFITSDGKWVYYHHGVDRTLWRVSTDGTDQELVFDRRAISYAVSPDGREIAFSELGDTDRGIGIASLGDGLIVKTFRVGFNESSGNDIAWMPDGKGLVYVDSADGENTALMFQRIDGKAPVRIADLGIGEVNSFAVAPDGKNFAIVQGGWKHDAVLLRGLKIGGQL